MAACALCGSNRLLVFDRELERWACAGGCDTGNRRNPAPRRAGREPLFSGFWTNPQTNERLGRATLAELREAWRLYSVHKDVRTGAAR